MSDVDVPMRRKHVNGVCPKCEEQDASRLTSWKDSHNVVWYVMRCGACLVVWLELPR